MPTTGAHGIIIPDPSTSAATVNQVRDLAMQTEAAVSDVGPVAGRTTGYVLTWSSGGSAVWSAPTGSAADATTTTKGIVQLAGDLGGTAAAPTVPGLAGKANTSHTHAAGDVTSGTLAIDRIPTGNTSTTVALGNHTHTAAGVSDFAEAVDDRVSALIVAGSGITKTYDDTAGTLTLAASGGGGSSTVDLASLKRNTDFALTNTTSVALAWDGQVDVTTGMHSTATNPSRVTAVQAGVYSLDVGLNIKNLGTGYVSLLIKKNGGTTLRDTGEHLAGQGTGLTLTGTYRLAAGDYVELLVWVRSAAAGVAAWGGYCFLQMARIGA